MPTDVVVLFVFEEHWTGALLRAQLLERGVEGVALPRLSIALVALSGELFGGALLAVAQHSTLTDRDEATLEALRAMGALAGTVLASSSVVELVRGRWDRVLRQPIAFGKVAQAVEELLRARAQSGVEDVDEKDRAAAENERAALAKEAGFELRVGPPWPMLRCLRCGATRHSDVPQTRAALGALRQAFAAFWVEHAVLHEEPD
jgi:hypothetical protein